uniref:Probable reductase n=1 Tax=Lepeophtheirus salmonis TaxID=72036 RepID=C1BSB5_LEPSM|nr:Probable reductase [Lepeophtheirus salmonis]
MALREFILSNGLIFPSVGLGTYQIKDLPLLSTSIECAFKAGYRLIDTASVYKNIPMIGKILEGRDDIFITSKLGPKEMGKEKASSAIERMLSELRRTHIDCLLIHWPGVQGLDPSDPRNEELRIETWKVLEDYYKQGVLRSIGVSNFNISHIESLKKVCTIVPHINQVECHPQYSQKELSSYCRHNGIHLQAYSSLGTTQPSYDPLGKGIKPLLEDPTVLKFSSVYAKSPAQILLKWALQNGYSVIPKSIHDDRIIENIQLFDFEIGSEHLTELNNIPVEHKYAWNSDSVF